MHADALDLAATADTAVHPLWRQQLGLLLQSTGDGIFGIDLDGNCMFINRAGARMIGHAPGALLGRNMHEVTHHSHADGAHYADGDCPIFNAFRRGLPCRIDSEVFWRADGTAFPVEYSSYPIVDGGAVRGAVVTFVDITERRRAADALRRARDELEQRVAERTQALSAALERQRELSAHLEAVREQERTRIAREVHDELGSLLVALKMDVNWLDKRLAEQQTRSAHEAEAMRTRLRSKCSHMSRQIETAVDNVGRIVTDLRPSILDHQGLWAALEWQAQEFVASAELRLHWRMQVAGAPEPAGALAMAVFRIFQEMLSNVGRHARARALSVDVAADARQLCVAVHDDGVGAPAAAFEAATAYGVMGMRERALHFGGRIDIASAPGAGATFTHAARAGRAMTAPIRILLADDHRIVREGLKQVLADAPEVVVAAEAASGAQVLAAVRAAGGRAGLDLVLLDIAMPDGDGLDVLEGLRKEFAELPVLMLSTYPERQYAVRCIRLGAAGYLHKGADPDDMLVAVRKAAAGGVYLSGAAAEALAAAVGRRGARPGADALSHREHQVLRLLTSGRSVGEIGAQLGLAANTVSTYRARILEKTGTKNDVELTLYVLNQG